MAANKWRISAQAGYLARPFIGRRARLVDVSVVEGIEDLYELQLDPQLPYDPESLWLERHEFEEAQGQSLGERLGFQPVEGRTNPHGHGGHHR